MGWRRNVPGRRRRTVVCGVALVASLNGCGGSSEPLSGPGATPVLRSAPAESVDVCDLVSAGTTSRLLDLPLLVVGRSVGSSRNASVICEIGREFGHPVVSVDLAPDPVARDVFEEAYGDPAGGNPVPVRHLGRSAYARTEGTNRVMHVFVHGAVLSVTVTLDPAGSRDSTTMVELVRLARAATESLPANPTIVTTTAPQACDAVNTDVLNDTLGRPPTLDAGLWFGSGSLVCSWGGQPGVITAALTDDRKMLSRFRDGPAFTEYLPVAGVVPRAEGRVYSSPDTSGDLVILVGGRHMIKLQVTPAAGYADSSIDTTEPERALAQAILADLG